MQNNPEESSHHIFEVISTQVSHWVGMPMTFVIALSLIVVWGLSGPVFKFSDTWQLIVNTGTTIITFLMVFLVQSSQNRDSAAIQAKLDELIRSMSEARNAYIGIENLSEVELEKARAKTKGLVAHSKSEMLVGISKDQIIPDSEHRLQT